MLNTAAIFAAGFIMRPIGGWLVGMYADRKGRKAALLVSVLAMCLGWLIIGLTPGYDRIGFAAPVLLVVARLLQGLSLGGEYASSATYLSEMADKKESRLLFQLRVHHAVGRPVARNGGVGDAAAVLPERRAVRKLGLAHSVPNRIARSRRCDLPAHRNMEETESSELHRQSKRRQTLISELFKHNHET